MRRLVTQRALTILPVGVFLVGCLLTVFLCGTNYVENDGIQYLSAARNIIDGHGISSSVIYYDAQYDFNQIPAPQTIFAPGFSLILSVIGLSGFDLPETAIVMNVLLLGSSALLLWFLLRRHGIDSIVCSISCVIMLSFVVLWQYSFGALTEPLYCFVMLLCLLTIPERREYRISRWVLPALLAGVSVSVRFSGILLACSFVAALALLAVLDMVESKQRWKILISTLTSSLLVLLPIGIVLGRNYGLTGTLFSRSGQDSFQSAQTILFEFGRSVAELFGFTSNGFLPKSLCYLLFFVLLLSMAWTLTRTISNNRGHSLALTISPAMVVSIVFLFATLVFFIITTHTSISVNINGRYLSTSIPVVLFLACTLIFHNSYKLPLGKKRTGSIVTGGLVLVFALGQINAAASVKQFTHHASIVDDALRLKNESDVSAHQLITESCANKQSPIISNGSQPLHYRTNMPTLGIPMKRYTDFLFTHEQWKKHAQKFEAKLLVFFPKLIEHYTETRSEAVSLNLLLSEFRKDNTTSVIFDHADIVILSIDSYCDPPTKTVASAFW